MIITFATSKGGAGKSTTAACLAGAFVSRGARVHIIDLDNNKTISRWYRDDASRPKDLTVSVPDQFKLKEHVHEIAKTVGPDITLIDVAGSFERTLIAAMANAHLTIIPASTSEAEIYEAACVIRNIHTAFAEINRTPLYRLLLTRVQPLVSHAHIHAFKEIARLKMPKFETVLLHRAAYEEIGLSGQPPHFADRKRPTVAKAISELDQLTAEIETLMSAMSGDKDGTAHAQSGVA